MPKRSNQSEIDVDRLRRALLGWYDDKARDLPWRVRDGVLPDPYRIWVSEVMLQQTTVATVGPYFRRFLARWPTLSALASSDLDDVLHEWQGLGYYSRARSLHKCARLVHNTLGGVFPRNEAELLKLPGIGPYTAGAIAAIAFDQPTVPVDGNIERVLARLFAIEDPLPYAKRKLWKLARRFAAPDRPGDFAQALMDLGATVCSPREPRCSHCPLGRFCQGYSFNNVDTLPRRVPKPKRPTKFAAAFIIVLPNGLFFLERRPDRGLLGGMMQVPLTPWLEKEPTPKIVARWAPIDATWQRLPGSIKHGFTHFAARLALMATKVDSGCETALEGVWCSLGDLDRVALPTMMKKVIRHAEQQGAINAV